MSFTSLTYLAFLLVAFALYWTLAAKLGDAYRKVILLLLSYVFYGWANWRYLPLLWTVTILAYGYGLLFSKLKDHGLERMGMIVVSCILFMLLGYFKYTNFLLETIWNAFHILKKTEMFLNPCTFCFQLV